MKTFATTDFHIAIVLSALGYNLVEIDKSQPRFIFHFEDNPNTPQIQSQVDKFFRGELSLDPRIILLHRKLITDRIHGVI